MNPSSVMSDYFDYVEQYRVASAALPETANIFWPRLQTRGLLIELAIKTYMCACGEIVSGHDLDALAQRAVANGLVLLEADSSLIRDVNKIYYRYSDWNATYLSRYPTPDRGLAFWVTPGHALLDEMISRIVAQARARRAQG